VPFGKPFKENDNMCTCLASMRPSVQIPVLSKGKWLYVSGAWYQLIPGIDLPSWSLPSY
jgi:hypothetical protein